jgi:hypothetical protein
MDAMPAGIYYLLVDSFYCGNNGSGCAGTACLAGSPGCFNGAYTLNFNCTTLAVTASSVSVGGRVTTADGRGLSNVRVTMTDTQGYPHSHHERVRLLQF